MKIHSIKMRNLFLMTLVFSFLVVSLGGCTQVSREEKTEVMATVVGKYTRGAHFTYAFHTKGVSPIYHQAVYRVTISYKGMKQMIYSKKLYDSVMKGDKIPAIFYQAWDSNGNVVKKELRVK